MKRIAIFIFAVLLFASDAFSQNTIKFLGIPIDGTKKEMIDALKAKGYTTYNSDKDILKGEFNGMNVYINVNTVNNRVWRIAVVTQSSTDDETNIKIRFNRLFDQFSRNGKYVLLSGEKLTDEDNISYEMFINNKRYSASFGLRDKTINGKVWYMIAGEFLNYRIAMFYENLDNAANGDDL